MIHKNFEDGTVAPLYENAPNIIIIYTDEHNFRTLGCYRSVLPDSLAYMWGEGIEAKHLTLTDMTFCIMISIPDPHGPNTVRAPYDIMYTHYDFQIPKTNGCDPHPGWREPVERKEIYYDDKNMANYFGMVRCIDDNVGRLYEKLDREGLTDNTIIIFTSDHGDMLGEFSRLDKGIPLEASTKVLFLISYLRKLPKGTVVNEAMSCVDFTPSLLDIVGLKHNFEFEGKSFAKLIREGEDEAWEDLAIIRGSQAGCRLST